MTKLDHYFWNTIDVKTRLSFFFKKKKERKQRDIDPLNYCS